MPLTAAETAAARRLIDLALAEDLHSAGDVTSAATIPAGAPGRAAAVARAAGVVAGLPVAALVCEAVDPALTFIPAVADGTAVAPGTELATVAGPMRSILTAERTALNFLQRLSGVATLTRRYVDQLAPRDSRGANCQILDTRKTTPGWRVLEKYAVRMGGGHNHRVGLYDGVLIKDNHLAALGGGPAAVPRAVAAARAHAPGLPVEVEVDTWEQFEAALACRPDIVLLDNMPPELLRRCAERRAEVAPGVLLEASGGVNLQTVGAIAATGVDRVSVGALTHSAAALDIALDYRAS
ncbi:MAG TPA: carboxylating nicotinate-nucleotide diphosphorylase [Gemmataceae bacterium]|jgi:nicotinate-nucleotide pyrophosphorylase (carboxylating)